MAADASPDLEAVYLRLREMAATLFARERKGHTLTPTALVHEAYVKMAKGAGPEWESRGHFYRTAARVMRFLLVDHARRSQAAKRPDHRDRVDLDVLSESAVQNAQLLSDKVVDLLDLDDALTDLEVLQPRQYRVVELRFFAGLTIPETAEALEIGTSTVDEDWAAAKGWLTRRLESAKPT